MVLQETTILIHLYREVVKMIFDHFTKEIYH